MKKGLRLILWVLLVLAADQWSKVWVRREFDLYESVDVIGHFFSLTYIENAGASFGILQNKAWLFVLLTVVIVPILTVVYWKVCDKNVHTGIALALVIGGAVGNMIDRVMKGTVTDMFNFHFWPVFNVADVALVLGLGFVAYRLIFHGEEF